MPELDYSRFDEFFRALWGHSPFAWQSALATRVLENAERPWPEAIALPTASGKTACLDIAIFALAAQADRLESGQILTTPRRIFFVVDRRVIVDEAFDRARKLADRLKGAQVGVIRAVADRLRNLAGGDTPLAVFQLRGGMYRSDAWAKSPTQPTLVASTVDQLGSRLLFRAYGSGPGTWPIHAGLAGNDALILLDEAHCAQPFLETLRAMDKYRRWGDSVPPLPFHVSVMSATPPEGITEIFRDESNEPRLAGHPLGDRQLAAKPAVLAPQSEAELSLAGQIAEAQKQLRKAEKERLSNVRGKWRKEIMKLRSEAGELLAAALVSQAELLVGAKPLATVIFCNRVATARAAWRILEKKHGSAAILLTGRMRPIDKDDTVSGRLAELSADKSKDRNLSTPVFVVATQTLEVGANLDFDVLVTECASLDALRQRFGRLNRMGRPINAQAAILIRADQSKFSEDDPVYGTALAATWAWLNQQPNLDMGIAALEPRLLTDKEKLAELNAPSAHAPVMLPSHVDCWAQTAPMPQPSPDVAVFLHGPGARTADVQVCWRADIDLELAGETWKDVLSLCPPSSPECLPVPIGLLRRWLAGNDDARADVSDVEGEITTEEESASTMKRKVVRWRGVEETAVLDDPDSLRPGDVVVIPASHGGWEALGDLARQADGQPVLDWGDRSHAQARAKVLLRLHPAVMAHWPRSAAASNLRDLARTAKVYFEEDPDGLTADLRTALAGLSQDMATPEWLKEVAAHLARDKALISLHPAGGLIVRGRKRLPREKEEEVDLFSDETDAAASGTVRQSLHEHSKGVDELARRFAAGCGLPQTLVDAVEFAAKAHDLGKSDPRFQSWLRGGVPFGQGGTLLAKSSDMPQSRAESAKARKRSGYPEGGRHELLSVRLLESVPDALPQDEVVRELVLHLIESHHGHCRPFAPVVFDETAPKVVIEWNGRKLEHFGPTDMERLDSGVTERFWRLTRRYGWWGLAWLEAILRLADHRRSEWEEKNT